MVFQALTTLVLALHFAYLAYVVVGGFLAWRWPWAIWPHLAAAGWGLVIAANPWGWLCPLTYVEHWSRRRAGQEGFDAGFIDRYIEGVLYPEQYTVVLQALAAVVVGVAWVGVLQRRRSRRDTDRKGEGSPRRTTTV